MLATLNLNPKNTAVITDPPYGCKNNNSYKRFTNNLHGGKLQAVNADAGIPGDNVPFDPTPWLKYKWVVMWGWQFYADKLPVGTVLVWNKKRNSQLGVFLSDCELAWQKGGKGVYLFNHVWHGHDRQSERGQPTLHPSQKPILLMRWCIERLRLPPGTTILDPYMGAGATGLAAIQLGYRFVGCDLVPTYFERTKQRLEAVQLAAVA